MWCDGEEKIEYVYAVNAVDERLIGLLAQGLDAGLDEDDDFDVSESDEEEGYFREYNEDK